MAFPSKPTIGNVDSRIVIARRALPDVAISSKPTIDNVDRVLSLRRFFATLRMTFIISLLIANYSLLIS